MLSMYRKNIKYVLFFGTTKHLFERNNHVFENVYNFIVYEKCRMYMKK